MTPSSEKTLKTIQTTCAYCGVGCGIEAKVDSEQHSVAIAGMSDHPANYGRLCSKGTALGDTLDLSGRLLHPEIDGQRVSWSDALDTVANGFRDAIDQYGPDSVAFYLSGQLLTEDYYVANKLMKGFLGSGNVDTNSRLCMSSSASGHKRAFGTDTVPGVYDDFEQADLITLVGSNTAWCHPVLFQRIKKAKHANPNLKVVVVDPRKTQTCEIADLHLPIRLGSDTILFNALLAAIARHSCLNEHYLTTYCEGAEQAIQAAIQSSGELEEVAQSLDLNIDDLRTFIGWFCDTEKSVTLYSQGVNQSSSGTDKVNSILNCHLATGRIGRPGMGPFSMTGQPNAMGGREVGGLSNTLAAHLEFEPESVNLVSEFWGAPNIATTAGKPAVELFDAMAKGDIKAVWIIATNPLVSLPNAEQVKTALETCPLVVVSDCVNDTDTLRHATVKLPATGWSEKDGTVTNSERRISRQRALFQPTGEARHDWWAICEVAKRLGYADHFTYAHQADIFREHAALSGYRNDAQTGRLRDFNISALSDLTNEEYEQLAPTQWPVAAKDEQAPKRFFAEGGFYTPNRRGRLIPITPKEPIGETSATYPFRLNTGRIRDQWHTMTRTALATQLNQHINESFVQMHPVDAARLSLSHGQLVEVASQWGQMRAPLEVTPDCRQGDLFAPMHWTRVISKQAAVNTVVNPHVDTISAQPESKHTPVKISAVPQALHGMLITELPHNWSKIEQLIQDGEFAYANTVNGKASTSTQFSVSALTGDVQEFVTSVITLVSQSIHEKDPGEQSMEDCEVQEVDSEGSMTSLRYEDTAAGDLRVALLDDQAQPIMAFFISPQPLKLDSVWLSQQFGNPLGARARRNFLSGFAPAGEDIGQVVCACFTVGDKTIKKAILNGCRSTQEIGQLLKAGTNCGSCLPELQKLINHEQLPSN